MRYYPISSTVKIIVLMKTLMEIYYEQWFYEYIPLLMFEVKSNKSILHLLFV